MNARASALFSEGIERLELHVAPDRHKALLAYLGALQALSTRMSVTSANTPEDWVETVLLDSLVLTKWIHGVGTLCDVGSGFGLPAIPVAIAEPGVRVVLVERGTKRCGYLRQLLADFAIAGDVRCEDVDAIGRIDADWFTARAFAAPDVWRRTALKIAPRGATVFTLHAGKELLGERYELPFSGRLRSVEAWTAP